MRNLDEMRRLDATVTRHGKYVRRLKRTIDKRAASDAAVAVTTARPWAIDMVQAPTVDEDDLVPDLMPERRPRETSRCLHVLTKSPFDPSLPNRRAFLAREVLGGRALLVAPRYVSHRITHGWCVQMVLQAQGIDPRARTATSGVTEEERAWINSPDMRVGVLQCDAPVNGALFRNSVSAGRSCAGGSRVSAHAVRAGAVLLVLLYDHDAVGGDGDCVDGAGKIPLRSYLGLTECEADALRAAAANMLGVCLK